MPKETLENNEDNLSKGEIAIFIDPFFNPDGSLNPKALGDLQRGGERGTLALKLNELLIKTSNSALKKRLSEVVGAAFSQKLECEIVVPTRSNTSFLL